MKKLSFILLVSISVLAISAFTFCSSTEAKAAPNEINTTDSVLKSDTTETKEKTLGEIEPKFKEEDGLKWYLDLNEAVAESTKEDKPILGFFTGSDWCGWCIKLQKNVLTKEEFKTWAEDNVVLMELDFPRRTQLSEELTAQNRNLQRLFQVSGFPTVWYFTGKKDDSTKKLNLTQLGKTGYPRSVAGGEAAAFIKASEAIINPTTSTDQ